MRRRAAAARATIASAPSPDLYAHFGLTPEAFARAVRAHWAIENAHPIRSLTSDEFADLLEGWIGK